MLQAKTAQENLIPALPLFLDTIRGQRSLITQLELPQLRQKVIIPYFYKMSNLFVNTDFPGWLSPPLHAKRGPEREVFIS
jgi:hypothetical protein